MKASVVALLLVGCAVWVTTPPALAEGLSIAISQPGEPPRWAGGTPAIVAGLWHDVRILGGGNSDPLVVTIHYGYTEPLNGTDATIYSFSYRAGNFTDELYGRWLDAGNCSRDGGDAVFRIAVNESVKSGPWTVAVNGSGSSRGSSPLSLEQPNPNFGLSAPDFLLRVDPFSPGVYAPEGASYFRTTNSGNLPMVLSIEYSALGDRMRQTNLTKTGAESQVYHYLSIDAPSWPPSERRITATVSAKPLLPASDSMMSLSQAFVLSFTAYIRVGRGGMVLEDAGVFALQHPGKLKCNYSKTLEYNVYLSGEKEVDISVTAESASLLSVRRDGGSIGFPCRIKLDGTSEVSFNISVKAVKDNVAARVRFDIKTTDGTVNRSYSDQIDVPLYQRPPPPPVEIIPNRVVPAIFLTLALVGAAAFIYFSYKKRGGHDVDIDDEEVEKAEETLRSRRRRRK